MTEIVPLVFKKAIRVAGAVSGHRQVIKALEAKQANFVFLASDCDEATYNSVISKLAKKHATPLCTKFTRAQLGEFAGQIRTLADGKVVRSVKASSCAICKVALTDEELAAFKDAL